MLLTLASVAATLLPVPQGQAEEAQPLLSKSELKSLNDKLRDYLAKWHAYETETGSAKRRQSLNKRMRSAEEKFKKDWDAKQKKIDKRGDLLASLVDLREVFRDVFPYDRERGFGEVKKYTDKAAGDFSMVVPKTFRNQEGTRSVLLVPGWDDAKGQYVSPKAFFESTWKGAAICADTLFVIPHVKAAIELDAVPDYDQPNGADLEIERIGSLLAVAGAAQRTFNFDRDRFILDCGRGSAGFGLRLATYFPARFAGLILRDVPAFSHLRLGSLTGFPVLIVADEKSKDNAVALHKALNELQDGQCTLIEAPAAGEETGYPFKAKQGEIASWAAKAQREVYRDRVVLAPNHDQFKRGHWVLIGKCEPLQAVGPADRPFLEAKADRATNRITVTTKSISDFALYLNDEIIDLSKEFTVVVNGTVFSETLKRDRRHLIELVQSRFDPTFLFTARYAVSVPKDN